MSVRMSTVSPTAKPNPSTSNSAARYQPGARSFAGMGISGPPSPCRTKLRPETTSAASPAGYPSLGHARNEVHQVLYLRGLQSLREGLRHGVGREPRRDEGVRLDDRFLDELLERESPLLGVANHCGAQIRTHCASRAGRRECMARATA